MYGEEAGYILIFIPAYLRHVITYFIVYVRAISKLQTRYCNRVVQFAKFILE